MKKLLQVLLIGDTIFLFGLWMLWTFKVDSAKNIFDVSNTSVKGINVLKSHVGGTFLIFTILVVLYFVQNKDYWAYAAMVSLGAIIFTRILTSIIDGFSTYALIALTNEAALLIILFFLITTFSSIKN